MFLSTKNSEFFYGNIRFFSTRKLHALDEYWSNNRSHPTHQKIHEMVENVLIERGEKTLKQERLDLIKNLIFHYNINLFKKFRVNIVGEKYYLKNLTLLDGKSKVYYVLGKI